mmetsp:Transcript_21776/g.55860  ORF Transcript_21776/g.55860 Transcript_21776/m.55860 type:complete len:289 (+) Transcript_21776:376-1242(+)
MLGDRLPDWLTLKHQNVGGLGGACIVQLRLLLCPQHRHVLWLDGFAAHAKVLSLSEVEGPVDGCPARRSRESHLPAWRHLKQPHRNVGALLRRPRVARGLEALLALQLSSPHRHLDLALVQTHPRDVLVPVHDKGGLRHFGLGGQVQPDLEQLQRVRSGLLDQGKHFAVDNALAGRHPLQIANAVAPRVPHGVGVVHKALGGGCERLKSTVWVLREARHLFPVVHAIWLAPVEVCAVSTARRFHFFIACWVVVLMIYAEEEGVQGLVREAQGGGRLHDIHCGCSVVPS